MPDAAASRPGFGCNLRGIVRDFRNAAGDSGSLGALRGA